MWNIVMSHISMLYMRSWLVALGTYVLAYTTVLALLFYYYGAMFVSEVISAAILDILYYVILLSWAACCSIMVMHTYESTQRRQYFSMKQQEREIKEWKRLLEDLPEPVVFSRRGEINFFNCATLDLLGVVEAVQGKTISERNEIVAEGLRHIKQKGHDVCLMDFILAKSATEFPTEETSFVYRRGPDKLNLTIKCMKPNVQSESALFGFIFHDVTSFKALQKNKAKETCFNVMLATASHDIRTPLNVTLGVLDVLDDYLLNEESKRQLKVARDCGRRMVMYLNGLSLLSKINTGSLELKRHTFRPANLARGMVDAMTLSAQTKQIVIKTNFDKNMPEDVCADEEMYAVILQNLVENAMKYTFDGGVTLSLAYELDAGLLRTSVADTGIGMTAEQVREAGELFKKSTCELNPQGLGLGLFLAKTLSSKMGGELQISSELGKGTVASFSIKTAPLYEAVPNKLSISTDTSPPDDDGPRLTHIDKKAVECDCAKVLLVDDEPLNLVVLAGYMRNFHLRVDKADNGKMAIEMINERTKKQCCKGYRVVFMDINMPVMDGVQATNVIKNYVQEGRIGKCNVVAVTAAARLDQPEVYDRYIAEGFTEMLSKPVPKKAFVNSLRKYVELD